MTKIKKVLLCTCAVACSAAMSITAFAEKVSAGQWKKGLCGGVSTTTENGKTVYVATGIDASYMSPIINIYPEIKKALEKNEEISVTVSFDAKATFEDEDGESPAIITMRADGFTDKGKAVSKDDFADVYKGSLFKKIDNSNVMSSGLSNNSAVLTNEWSSYEIVLDLYQDEDMTDELFTKWNLCFSSISKYDEIKSIELTEPVLTIEAGSGAKATPTPEATPTATATAAATATPTATAKATATAIATATATPEPTESGSKTGLIVGIVIAAVAVLGGGGAAAYFIIKKKKASK